MNSERLKATASRRGSTFLVSFLCVSAVILSGCHSSSWTRSEVYFGLSKPDGGMVDASQWQQFVDDEITPRFPQGFTVLPASGQWREASGKIAREESRVLILLAPPGDDSKRRIEEIRAIYKERFGQEAVLKVTSPAKVEF